MQVIIIQALPIQQQKPRARGKCHQLSYWAANDHQKLCTWYHHSWWKNVWPPRVRHTRWSHTPETATFQRFNPPTSCWPNQGFKADTTTSERHDWRRLIGPCTTEIWLKWSCWRWKKPETSTKQNNYEGMWELWNVPWTWMKPQTRRKNHTTLARLQGISPSCEWPSSNCTCLRLHLTKKFSFK